MLYKKLFNKLDTNKQGYLDKQSLSSLYNQEPQHYAELLIEQCDKTKDGKITFEEFKEFCFKKELELERLFYLISKDGKTIKYSELETSAKEAGILFFIF